jgi:hypothetical protein
VTLLARTLLVLLLILVWGVEVPSHSAGAGRSNSARLHVPSPSRSLSIKEAWLANPGNKSLQNIGRGKGIVFSPDLSEPGNRSFYNALGFAYFEAPDWRVVLEQLKTYNQSHPDNPVEVLLVQSHGTNGDALKLQTGNQPDAPRSYISPGGLLETLQGTGVRVCLLAACNAGRLFRPENFHSVKAGEGNHLFEPATLGVINASPAFDPAQSRITIARRAESHIELINECSLSEFSAITRNAILESNISANLKATTRIAVPEMLIQLLLSDEQLRLVADGFEMEKSRAETNQNYREQLIRRFLRFVDSVPTKTT